MENNNDPNNPRNEQREKLKSLFTIIYGVAICIAILGVALIIVVETGSDDYIAHIFSKITIYLMILGAICLFLMAFFPKMRNRVFIYVCAFCVLAGVIYLVQGALGDTMNDLNNQLNQSSNI